MNFFIYGLIGFILISVNASLQAQSLVEDATLAPQGENIFTETIKIISGSKKIFIITNSNQQLGPGDFISLALDNKLAARALVAKTHQGQVGIKILKIYSLTIWGRLKQELPVQIIKGDDSSFGKKAPTPETQIPETAQIKTEEDLYTGNVVVEDDLEFVDENKNRHIKPDNIVAITGSFLDAEEPEYLGGTARATEFGISWAYQFSDNFFIEGIYSRALFDNFPSDGSQTLVNHVTGRLKYNWKGPLYTFLMPYIGFHTYTVSSPDAENSNNPTVNEQQLDALDKLKKSGPVVGVTVLRRLVPGWFIKADLGTDTVNLGFAIEF